MWKFWFFLFVLTELAKKCGKTPDDTHPAKQIS